MRHCLPHLMLPWWLLPWPSSFVFNSLCCVECGAISTTTNAAFSFFLCCMCCHVHCSFAFFWHMAIIAIIIPKVFSSQWCHWLIAVVIAIMFVPMALLIVTVIVLFKHGHPWMIMLVIFFVFSWCMASIAIIIAFLIQLIVVACTCNGLS